MKLLTKPDANMEVIEYTVPARHETRFHPLGLLGIGPLTTTQEIPARTTIGMLGRKVLKKIQIDFEDEDAIDLCIDVGVYDMIKRKTEFKLAFDEKVYIIHGVIPEKCLRDNVWECNIDHYEY